MKWEKNDVEMAIKLHNEGRRFNEIANQLNRDERSVQCRLNNLGFHQNKLITCETIVCAECGKDFIGKRKDKRKFCSQSCTNKNHTKKNRLHNCLNCNKLLNSHQFKFCSKECDVKYKLNVRFNEIENGNMSFSEKAYKQYLINKHGNKCMKCGWNEVNPVTGLVPIQLEHKDGNSENHNLDNLELLCPNHHSLTSTFGALNKGNGRTKRRDRRNEKKVQ
jgi:predicted transcriptional regulator